MLKLATENLKKVDYGFVLEGLERIKDELAWPSNPVPYLVINRKTGQVFIKAYTSPEHCDMIKVLDLFFIANGESKDPEVLERIIKEGIESYLENEIWAEFTDDIKG